jgi:hypothetical protein
MKEKKRKRQGSELALTPFCYCCYCSAVVTAAAALLLSSST